MSIPLPDHASFDNLNMATTNGAVIHSQEQIEFPVNLCNIGSRIPRISPTTTEHLSTVLNQSVVQRPDITPTRQTVKNLQQSREFEPTRELGGQ